MRLLLFLAPWLLPAAGLLGQAPDPGDDPQNPRAELDALAVELEAAVGRVSQPGVEPLLGAEAARGYYLPGQGAFFVLPPRALPRESRQIIVRRGGTVPGSGAMAPDGPELRELEQLLGPEEARRIVQEQQLEAEARQELARRARERRQLSPEREAELRRLEKQVEAFQREAERARQEAERTWAEMLLDVQQRLQGTHAAAGAPGPGGGTAAPEAGLPPPPPWRFWFGTEDPEDARAPQQVMDDVRAAIVAALEAHGARLRNVAGQEQVSVAVDFLPRGLFATSQRPVRTLVVRVRKQWLEERQDGRLAGDELRRRVEVSGY